MEKIISFESAEEWEEWMAKNHLTSNGIWMRRFKKDSGIKCVSTQDSLDTALCYGWITGQAKPYDKVSILWRFCPRRPRSMWSKLNKMHAERLIKEGKMKKEGYVQINAAKKDGRWQRAYSPPSTAKVPPYFIKELNKNRVAKEFFEKLNKPNRYAIIFRLENTPKERRKQKVASIIGMLEKGESYH